MLGQNVLFLILLITAYVFANTDYCKIKSCKRKRHTMCKHKGTKPGSKCNQVIAVGLNQGEKDELLKMHNNLRQKVARGEETRGHPGPQPAATNMAILQWDDELANIAQRWANQCDYKHDHCRDVERFPVGQNIGYEGTTGDINDFKLEDLPQIWYDEVKDFNSKNVKEFKIGREKDPKIGHYTQFVWGNTSLLGCGQIKYVDNAKFKRVYLVCNYAPAGNWLHRPIYNTK